ncbi:MAG TPA: M48 family metallopeptidase [Actinomycetota bacterium]|nr:M48 family metallopeptidase [Actinomycetota bacterium]
MYEQVAANRRRSALLVLGMGVLFAAVGWALGAWLGSPVAGVVVAVAVALLAALGSFRYGDRIVLASAGAREVSAEEQPRLHNIVEGLAIAAGIPKPRVYVIPEAAPNAFATGRDPRHAAVAVTEGLLETMNRVELEGVIAHEIAHVVDRDVLLGTVVATLVGAVVLVAELVLRATLWGAGGSRRRGGEPALLVALPFLLLAPLAAQVVRFAISREREFLADAQGALLTRYPPGLASALRKIAAARGVPMRASHAATAHLWISQPSRLEGERTGWLERLFSTHPPIEERIRRLEEM